MNRVLVACVALGVVFLGLNACGNDASLSGSYVAEIDGNSMEIHFLDGGKATFGMTENGQVDTRLYISGR